MKNHALLLVVVSKMVKEKLGSYPSSPFPSSLARNQKHFEENKNIWAIFVEVVNHSHTDNGMRAQLQFYHLILA